jgi:type II secretory pathway component PulF|tara:strand:- start:162 stop:497 length:336 start_codon:yes stop_codon:yes gene_type:complete
MPDEIATASETASLEKVLGLLTSGSIRELNDITDLCAEAMHALVTKQLTTSAARELRQWAELMYTCVQSQRSQEGDVNFITQLVQMNGLDMNEEAAQEIPDTIIDMKSITG